MSVEELIGKLWALVETWGPVVMIVYAVLFVLVLSFAVFVLVKVIRGMSQMDRHHKAMRKRMGRF